MQLFKQHQKCIKTVDFKVDHKYTIRLNYTRSRRIGERRPTFDQENSEISRPIFFVQNL